MADESSTKSVLYANLSQNYGRGKFIAVMTSGGDSQGMNSAIRAVVRMGLYLGCKMFFIKEGYQGLVDGGDNIVQVNWASVSNILHVGGTVIGSARCMDFKEREGRLKAAENLVNRGITNLVVIGGDGSLTGANLFRVEWSSLLDELAATKRITSEQQLKHKSLHIAGMVGSIDNDFCGTDMTIGTDSALHRIIEAIDAIVSTAYSHQRTFIMEVMGRHCGYLALASSIACEADFMFIPEFPVPIEWPKILCEKLSMRRSAGERLSIIIITEGAIDLNGNHITSEMVRKVIETELNQDTRVTVLGHVQRGGNPSAFDQIMACRLGAEAILTLVEAKDDTQPSVIVQDGNRICSISLMKCVERTQAVAKAIKEKRFHDAVKLRGRSFERNLDIYKLLAKTRVANTYDKTGREQNYYTLAVVHIGAPACGMNAAVHSFVRNCIFYGHTVYGIYDGIEGLATGNLKKFNWIDVTGWVGQGSANLRSNRTLAEGKFKEIAKKLREFNIQGLLAVGGFEAYHSLGQMSDQREHYQEFQIPMCLIPATISNNVPGTEFCLGADTSLNEICTVCHNLRLAGQGTKRVYVVETMGGYCGYLATLAGLASGADAAYIFEEKFSINDIERDFENMSSKMADGVQRGLILRNALASSNYTTDFIGKLFSEEGKDQFSTRTNILGHWQQGGTPTPFDRNMGIKMAAKSSKWMVDQLEKCRRPDGTISARTQDSACVLCLQQRSYNFVPLKILVEETDFKHRIPVNQWWMSLRPLMKILAMHHSAYRSDNLTRLKSFVEKNHHVQFHDYDK